MTFKRCITVAACLAVAGWMFAMQAAADAAPLGPPPSNSNSARLGAGYLAQQIDTNGGFIESFGSPDVPNTAYAVLGLHSAGAGAHEEAKAISYLETQLGNLKASDGSDDPGALGYVTMAAVASRRDPRHFGGHAAINDLVGRLLATVRKSGPDAGLFGSADPTYDGAFRQGVALAALAAAGVPVRFVASSIAWLERQQCANGLWTSYRPDTTVACPAADPTNFVGPDTNSTSMAVQGLAAYGRSPRRLAVLLSLLLVQSSDGGYPDIAASGQASDPDSTALTIQALLAEHWQPGRRTFGALRSYQLGCSDPAGTRGAYFFPPTRTPSTLATVQAVPAAAGVTLPLPPSRLSSDVPSTTCRPGKTTVASTRQAAAVQPAIAGTAGPCSGNSGVTVVVDFTAFNKGVQTRCAPGAQSSGIAAMENAGFAPEGTERFGLAFVCRINDLPSSAQQDCVGTPPANAYWAYYHALAGATTWTYGATGPSSYVPPLGSIDAWAFGNSAQPSVTPAQVRSPK